MLISLQLCNSFCAGCILGTADGLRTFPRDSEGGSLYRARASVRERSAAQGMCEIWSYSSVVPRYFGNTTTFGQYLWRCRCDSQKAWTPAMLGNIGLRVLPQEVCVYSISSGLISVYHIFTWTVWVLQTMQAVGVEGRLCSLSSGQK